MLASARRRPPSWFLIFAAWLVPALLAAFNSYAQSRLEGHPPDWRWVFFNSLDWLIYALLTPAVFRVSRRLPLEQPHLARNISLHVVGALLMCVAWAALGTALQFVIFPRPTNGETAWLGFVSWAFTTLPFGFGVYFALLGIQHSFFYFAQVREREVRAARLAAQLSEARLSALRMQLHPHFLFNSLNAITVLVRDSDITSASRMLELLSDLLRQVLNRDEPHEAALAEEIEFVERYLAIEQIRFSDRLRPRIEVDRTIAQAAVPRFILQPLIENALRHGIARRADAGMIQVSAHREGDQLVLMVRDDGHGLQPVAHEGSGGLVEYAGAPLGALRRQGEFGDSEPARRRCYRNRAPAVS